MLDEFYIFLQLGFEHITDFKGIDHMLFLAALCAVYQWTDWKRVLWLVTAFTIGHSVTLALTALGILSPPAEIVEFLIALTIFITSVYNITQRNKRKLNHTVGYVFFFGFGLIHGLGFAGYLRNLLGSDGSDLIWPLFSFNIGLELGQIIIVILILVLSLVMTRLFRLKPYEWILILSGSTAGISLTMMLERI